MLEAIFVYSLVRTRVPSGAEVSVIVGCLIDILANREHRGDRRGGDQK